MTSTDDPLDRLRREVDELERLVEHRQAERLEDATDYERALAEQIADRDALERRAGFVLT